MRPLLFTVLLFLRKPPPFGLVRVMRSSHAIGQLGYRLGLLLFFGVAASSQELPPIGIIDFYGADRVKTEQIREALPLKIGDQVPKNRETLIRTLEKVPGVRKAHLDSVCCEQGKAILYVG